MGRPRVVIDDLWITVEGFDLPLTDKGRGLGLHSCRTVSHEAMAWAVKRLGQELEKSCAFYRTGEATDNVAVD